MLSFRSLTVRILAVDVLGTLLGQLAVGVLVLVDVVAATLGSLGPTLLAVDIC
jgi:hypothetical protein